MVSSEMFRPGAVTPAAGVFVCNCPTGHLWRIDLAGHVFPPLPPGCSGAAWSAAAEAFAPAEHDGNLPAA